MSAPPPGLGRRSVGPPPGMKPPGISRGPPGLSRPLDIPASLLSEMSSIALGDEQPNEPRRHGSTHLPQNKNEPPPRGVPYPRNDEPRPPPGVPFSHPRDKTPRSLLSRTPRENHVATSPPPGVVVVPFKPPKEMIRRNDDVPRPPPGVPFSQPPRKTAPDLPRPPPGVPFSGRTEPPSGDNNNKTPLPPFLQAPRQQRRDEASALEVEASREDEAKRTEHRSPPPPPTPREQQRPQTAGPTLPRFPGSMCMSSKDIFYVVRSQMKALEVADSYTEDYYNHKFQQKKQCGARHRVEARPLVSPVWVQDKAHIRSREEHMRQDQKTITHKWEEGHRVLGHLEKTDVHRPRALLNVENVASVTPFSGLLWVARRAVDAGVSSLLALEEARGLLAMLDDPEKIAAARDMEREHLRAVVAAVCDAQPHAADLGDESVPWNLDELRAGSIEALLTLPKGVKLLARFVATLPATAAASILVVSFLAVRRNSDVFAEEDAALISRIDALVLARAPLQTLVAQSAAQNTTLARLVLNAGDLRTPVDAPRDALAAWQARRHFLR